VKRQSTNTNTSAHPDGTVDL